MRQMRSKLRFTIFVAACLASVTFAAPGHAQTVPKSQPEIALSFAPVVKEAAPAVVNIYATVVVQTRAHDALDDARVLAGVLQPALQRARERDVWLPVRPAIRQRRWRYWTPWHSICPIQN